MTFEELELLTFEELELLTFEELEQLTAVYDRNQSDITNKTDKGYMKYTDFNRVEQNIKFVADELGIAFTKKTWVRDNLPTVSDYARWKIAIDLIKSTYDVLQTAPDRPFNTFTKWNQLEYLLWYTDKIFNANQQEQSYCGEFYCGEWGLI